MKSSLRVKASAEKRSSRIQTQACRHLCHILVWASSLTVRCSPCYTSVNHCFSSLTSRILFWTLLHCFLDFTVTGFGPELLRRPHISQDEFW